MEAVGFPLLGGAKEAKEKDEKDAKAEQERERKRKETEELKAEMAKLRELAGGGDNESLGGSSTHSLASNSMASVEAPHEERNVDRYGVTIMDKLLRGPRASSSLEEVHRKLRHILHTIASAGMHLKILELITLHRKTGSLLSCDDPNATTESLAQLQHVFGYIEKEWEKADERIDARERAETAACFASNDAQKRKNNNKTRRLEGKWAKEGREKEYFEVARGPKR